jgi:hypothetical protein
MAAAIAVVCTTPQSVFRRIDPASARIVLMDECFPAKWVWNGLIGQLPGWS